MLETEPTEVTPRTERVVLCENESRAILIVGAIAFVIACVGGLTIAACLSVLVDLITLHHIGWIVVVASTIGTALFFIHLFEIKYVFPECCRKTALWTLSVCAVVTAIPCGCAYLIPGPDIAMWGLACIFTGLTSLIVGCEYFAPD
ncbi:MAG TPA: hypothetical protein PLF31_02915 [Candidatus Paceibacterota bacterium]|nr:hypothetical protein [Candidatus Paceibacterota bacterium]